MKSFLKTVLIFGIPLVVLVIVGLLVPPTPRSATSHLFAKYQMDARLRTVSSPRLILVGGSNISLSINSQIIKDSLNVNPINTGISVNIGLTYMLDNTLRFVRPHDIVVISPEYDQFFDKVALGGEDLVRTVFDVSPKSLMRLRPRQVLRISPLIPYFALSKLKVREYITDRDSLEIYDRNAFNIYGDNCKHWKLPSQKVDPLQPLDVNSFDNFVIDLLREFEVSVNQRGAKMFITFPALQEATFSRQIDGIRKVEGELRKAGFSLLGTPERYVVPDSLLFDTPYHLIKKGVDQRTSLLVQDLKRSLSTSDSIFNERWSPNLIVGKAKR